MSYDWTKSIDRTNTGSYKWMQMKDWCPEVKEGIFPFSVADCDISPTDELKAGLIEFVKTGVFGYTGATEGYLKAVCDWLERRHHYKIDKEWIVLSSGVVPSIYTSINAYTKEGDGIIIQQPVYYPFMKSINETNRKIVNNALIDNDGHYEIDFEDLESKAKDPKNTMMVFCSPHNPVGRVWTKEELTKVGEICADNNVILISDEIHFDLVRPGYKHTIMARLNEKIAQNTVTLTAPSKTFNIAGLQTSNIIIENERLRNLFKATSSRNGFHTLNAFGFKACEIVYTQSEKWLDDFIALIYKNADTLKDYMEKELPMIKVYTLEGTYLQWMDFSALNMSNEELEKFLHKDCQLFFDEGYIFGSEGNGFERMNIACPTVMMLEGLERLKTELKKRGY